MKYIPIVPRPSSTRNMKEIMPRHVLIKLLKIIDKEKIIKAVRKKKHIEEQT